MAFPTTAVIETFTGVDGTTPPNANWSNSVYGTGTRNVKIVGNALGVVVAAGQGWWNAATFGPAAEVYTTVPTKPGTVGFYCGVYLRLASPGGAGVDGYSLYFVQAAGTDTWEFYRLDNAVETLLGAAITPASDMADGQKFGLEALGTTLTGYMTVTGTWGSIGTRTDATYSAAGYIGAYIDGSTTRLDGFGGGTVVVADRPKPSRRSVARSRSAHAGSFN